MVKAMKEFPFVVLIEVSLPKIYGFEVCRKLKAREEAKNMKFILVPSIFDKSKYRREPASLYGADDYIEPEDIPGMLVGKINRLANTPEEGAGRVPEERITVPEENQLSRSGVPFEQLEIKRSPVQSASKDQDEAVNEVIEKAKRLSRTIVNDIFLYNSTKVMDSIKSNTFLTIFAAELREGQKLYENRIPPEIRNGGNYYRETIEEFIFKKKKELN
jgi:response regulator RpfG family c-di-GMP phosphodiesterase